MGPETESSEFRRFLEKRELLVLIQLPSVVNPGSVRLETVVKRTALALLAVPALVSALVAPAHGEAVERHVLSVQSESEGWVRQVVLECDPVGGTHPRAEEACEAIAEAGSVEGVTGAQNPCPMIYAPVVATAHGEGVYRQEFPNHCVLLNDKGAVFDF